MKDVLDIIKNRRTIRRYKSRSVPNAMVKRVLDAARWAPSPHNSQPWQFLVIKSEKSKMLLINMLRRATGRLLASTKPMFNENIDILEGAPVLILVLNTNSFSNKTMMLDEPYFSIAKTSEIEAIGAAIQNMQIIATALGIGAGWINVPLLARDEIVKHFRTSYEPVAFLLLGYPAEEMCRASRKRLKDIVKYL